MKGKYSSNQNKNYLILLLIIIIFESFIITYFGFQYQNIKSTNNSNVSISLKLISSSNMVTTVNLTFSGKGKNLTLPLSVHQLGLIIGKSKQQNLTTNTIQKSPTTIFYRTDLVRSIIFTGLQPYSNYNIKVVGSSKPYCYAGYMCPMYILNIDKSINLTTGKQGSISNISIRLS